MHSTVSRLVIFSRSATSSTAFAGVTFSLAACSAAALCAARGAPHTHSPNEPCRLGRYAVHSTVSRLVICSRSSDSSTLGFGEANAPPACSAASLCAARGAPHTHSPNEPFRLGRYAVHSTVSRLVILSRSFFSSRTTVFGEAYWPAALRACSLWSARGRPHTHSPKDACTFGRYRVHMATSRAVVCDIC